MIVEAGRQRRAQGQAMRARRNVIRERVLFDIGFLAADIAIALECRLAAIEIIGEGAVVRAPSEGNGKAAAGAPRLTSDHLSSGPLSCYWTGRRQPTRSVNSIDITS